MQCNVCRGHAKINDAATKKRFSQRNTFHSLQSQTQNITEENVRNIFHSPEGDVLILQVGTVNYKMTSNPLTTLLQQRSLAGQLQWTRVIIVPVPDTCSTCHQVRHHVLSLLPVNQSEDSISQ